MAFIKKKYIYIKNLALVFILISCSAKPQEWKKLNANSSCNARHECGFVANNDILYLIGGRGIKPVDAFNINLATWESLNHTPIEMHHITPISFEDKIYIVTGLTGGYPEEKPLSHIYTFSPENNTWKTIFEIPENRRRGAAGVTLYNDKIYVANGITNGHTSGTTSMFDVYDLNNNTWTILDDAPHIRDHCAAVIIDEKLITLGGRNTSYHETDNFEAFFSTVKTEVDYFDFKTQKWKTYASKLPNPAAGGGAVSLGDEIYYIGGETGKKEANKEMFAFNPKTEQWQQKPNLNIGRHGTNAVTHGLDIYIVAGSGNQGGSPELNSIEVYKHN